jgi:glutaredoxin
MDRSGGDVNQIARRGLLASGAAGFVLFALGVRKYVNHRRRIPLLSLDGATLAAARTVHVTIYSAEWCHSCRNAEQFLRENGIPFELRDVERDPAAAARLAQLNPSQSIPVIDIEGSVLLGYEPNVIEATLARVAQAHLNGGAGSSGSPHS